MHFFNVLNCVCAGLPTVVVLLFRLSIADHVYVHQVECALLLNAGVQLKERDREENMCSQLATRIVGGVSMFMALLMFVVATVIISWSGRPCTCRGC